MESSDRRVPLEVCSSPDEAAGSVRSARRAGWRVREGFALPWRQWGLEDKRIVCTGAVADDHALAQAVMAASRGCGVIAWARGDFAQALEADLRRLEPESGVVEESLLSEEERALLEHLASGSTIAAAAKAEFVALRTANRRIAAARSKLGVSTTREAVLAFTQWRERS